MFRRIKTIKIIIILTGLIAGYFYWRFIGCTSGTCPLTSNWYSSVFFGGLIGYLLSDSIPDVKKKKDS